MDPVLIASLLSDLSVPSTLKVVHSVLDSLNRRRAPSREVLMNVDGPEDAERTAEIAGKLVKQIEGDEGHELADLSPDLIRHYAEMLLAVAGDKSRANSELPAVDESRGRALLDSLRKESIG